MFVLKLVIQLTKAVGIQKFAAVLANDSKAKLDFGASSDEGERIRIKRKRKRFLN